MAREPQREWEGRYGSGPKPEPPATGIGTATGANADKTNEADDSGPLQRMEDGREGQADGDAAGRAGPGGRGVTSNQRWM